MNWFNKNKDAIFMIAVVMVLFSGIVCTLYFGSQEASDPKVLRRFRITLISGEKKAVSFWINHDSEVWIETYKGSYWLDYTWHSRIGWKSGRLKAGVIDFEEIKLTNR